MEWAYDRVTNQRVAAEDAKRNEYRYRCPNPSCGAPVYFASGAYMREHFRHYPGQGVPDCENYHSGVYQFVEVGSTADRHEKPEYSRVGLELYVTNERHVQRWVLKLRLPQNPMAAGAVDVRFGPGFEGIKPLNLAALRNSALRLEAAPTTEALGIIRFHPDVPQWVQSMYVPAAIKLEPRCYTVFHSSAFGTQSTVGPSLYWGNSYYFLSPDAITPVFPDALHIEELPPLVGWMCYAVTMPSEPDPDVVAWVKAKARLDFATRKAGITVVVPSLVQENRPEELRAGRSAEVVFGMCRLGRELLNGNLQIESGSETLHVEISKLPNAVVHLSGLNPNGSCVFLRFGAEPGVLLDLGKPISAVAARGPALSAQASDGTLSTAPFGSVAAHRLLRSVRARRLTKLCIQTLTPIELQVSATRRAWSRSDTLALAANSNQGLVAIEKFLRDARHEVFLRCRGFGSHLIGASAAPLASVGPSIRETQLISGSGHVVANRYGRVDFRSYGLGNGAKLRPRLEVERRYSLDRRDVAGRA